MRSLLVVALMFVIALGCGGSTTDFRAEVIMPPQVTVGATFPLTVRVYNLSAKPQELDSLDFSNDFMTGIVLNSSDPPFVGFMDVPIDETHSYEYLRAIPGNTSLDIVFEAYAGLPGDYDGELDVCVGSAFRFNTYPIRTMVSE